MKNIRKTTRRKLIFALWLAKPVKQAKYYSVEELLNNSDL